MGFLQSSFVTRSYKIINDLKSYLKEDQISFLFEILSNEYTVFLVLSYIRFKMIMLIIC